MSTVEEVARAIRKADHDAYLINHPGSSSEIVTLAQEKMLHQYDAMARAAIKEMDNPSDDFLAALAERMHDARFSKSGEDYPVARNFIRSFIDAALSEEGR